MAKYASLAISTWYDWYDWLINQIPKSVKKSARNVKERIMNLFETENCVVDNNMTKDHYKPVEIGGVFGNK